MPARSPRIQPSRRSQDAYTPMTIEVSEEAGVRYLHFGSSWIQGAMRVRRSHALELEYTRDMMFPLLLDIAPQWPRRVLIIGLGAASITKFLHRHRPRSALTVVEIEPRVVAAARQHFKLPQDPARLAVELGDGAAYVAGSGPAFDWIIVDGFDARGLAGALDTRAFYRNCRARLAERGVLTTNLLRRSRGCAASVARIGEAFDERVLTLPTCASGNTVAVAITGPRVRVARTELRHAADALRAGTGLNLVRTVGRLAAATPPGGVLML
jgi:spermidine synthase